MRAIDVHHLGIERVICAWQVGDVIVDPGPEPALPALLDALGDWRPRALLLTHIHLDHAGATGALVQRWPDLEVYVHERGAPHVIDPSKLMSSAGRLYGEDNMKRLWGEVLPVPAEQVHALSGGDARRRRRRARRLHARPRLASRRLPARGERPRLRRRRRRRADPAARPRDRADAAAGHRRREVGGLARPDRRLETEPRSG